MFACNSFVLSSLSHSFVCDGVCVSGCVCDDRERREEERREREREREKKGK